MLLLDPRAIVGVLGSFGNQDCRVNSVQCGCVGARKGVGVWNHIVSGTVDIVVHILVSRIRGDKVLRNKLPKYRMGNHPVLRTLFVWVGLRISQWLMWSQD